MRERDIGNGIQSWGLVRLREISHLGKVIETLEVWAVASSCCYHTLSRSLSWRVGVLKDLGGRFLSSETFPVASIYIGTHFRSGTLVEEYRSDDEKHVLQCNHPLTIEKYAFTAKAHCCLNHNMFETGGNTNIPLHIFHRRYGVDMDIFSPYEYH
ncbi:hypothetical protein TNCV_1417441 [Trichonephila clavipes]|nr:hypothetical protein TNCV_1417441 [Trichonephila clavipes]